MYILRILQIASSIHTEATGPSYSVVHLSQALQDTGQDVHLYCVSPKPNGTSLNNIQDFLISSLPCRSIERSPEMRKAICSFCKIGDIVQTNSLWMMPMIYPGKAIIGTKCKLVVAPRGTLAAWALKRNKWKKLLSGYVLGQFQVLKQADMFYATSIKEYEEIRAQGYHQPIAVIPIGIDEHDIITKKSEPHKLLFLGRVHPVKAVDRLLIAWSKVANEFPKWILQIVGPDCGLGQILHNMVKDQQIPRVEFVDELNGKDKFHCYASADIYVLPSFTENFGITVAEAMSCGIPVIVSSNTPWHDVTKHKCGWVTDNSPEKLTQTLREALNTQRVELEIMGQRGKKWMIDDFSWKSIAQKTISAYKWLLNKDEKPDFVIID